MTSARFHPRPLEEGEGLGEPQLVSSIMYTIPLKKPKLKHNECSKNTCILVIKVFMLIVPSHDH